MDITKTYNELFKTLLQKNVHFIIKNKAVKRGKILLYNQNEFFIEFTLEDARDSKIRKYNIPIPFAIENWADDGLIYCDYRLSTLSLGDRELKETLFNMNDPETSSKFFNTILQIEIKDAKDLKDLKDTKKKK